MQENQTENLGRHESENKIVFLFRKMNEISFCFFPSIVACQTLFIFKSHINTQSITRFNYQEDFCKGLSNHFTNKMAAL